MYSSEYTSGFSWPAALQLAVSPSPRDEGNVEQAPSPFNSLKKATSWGTNQQLDQPF